MLNFNIRKSSYVEIQHRKCAHVRLCFASTLKQHTQIAMLWWDFVRCVDACSFRFIYMLCFWWDVVRPFEIVCRDS